MYRTTGENARRSYLHLVVALRATQLQPLMLQRFNTFLTLLESGNTPILVLRFRQNSVSEKC